VMDMCGDREGGFMLQSANKLFHLPEHNNTRRPISHKT